ncbi:hypothetical protein LTR66_002182 [Elasticomyces elasticus]|nr:hypothetical protein LTR66_002182 [Elasticomyces elasticus]
MVLKRKRAASDPRDSVSNELQSAFVSVPGQHRNAYRTSDAFGSLSPSPLTVANLSAHNASMPPSSSSLAKASLASVSKASLPSGTGSDAENRLKTWYIFIDRKWPTPAPLSALVAWIKTPRDDDPTPKSRRVVDLHPEVKQMKESKALFHNLRMFGADTRTQGGDPNLDFELDVVWREGCIPKPNTSEDKTLEAALKKFGCPPRPKPDVVYGYAEDTFSAPQMNVIRSLSPAASVTDSAPYMPFYIHEWKAEKTGGNLYQAKLQAARDGAAAVNAMRVFLLENGVPDPGADATAVFSACVTSELLRLSVHWRRVDDRGQITWEMDHLYMARLEEVQDVFAARSVILRIMTWAVGERLKAIRSALDRPIVGRDIIVGPSVLNTSVSPDGVLLTPRTLSDSDKRSVIGQPSSKKRKPHVADSYENADIC